MSILQIFSRSPQPEPSRINPELQTEISDKAVMLALGTDEIAPSERTEFVGKVTELSKLLITQDNESFGTSIPRADYKSRTESNHNLSMRCQVTDEFGQSHYADYIRSDRFDGRGMDPSNFVETSAKNRKGEPAGSPQEVAYYELHFLSNDNQIGVDPFTYRYRLETSDKRSAIILHSLATVAVRDQAVLGITEDMLEVLRAQAKVLDCKIKDLGPIEA